MQIDRHDLIYQKETGIFHQVFSIQIVVKLMAGSDPNRRR